MPLWRNFSIPLYMLPYKRKGRDGCGQPWTRSYEDGLQHNNWAGTEFGGKSHTRVADKSYIQPACLRIHSRLTLKISETFLHKLTLHPSTYCTEQQPMGFLSGRDSAVPPLDSRSNPYRPMWQYAPSQWCQKKLQAIPYYIHSVHTRSTKLAVTVCLSFLCNTYYYHNA
jgi:hypothetical protein